MGATAFSASIPALRTTIGDMGFSAPAPLHSLTVQTGHPQLVAAIREEIAANGGRITFARFMTLALHHPRWGYYHSPARRPGRPGYFLSAPESHTLF
jgi:hypothetical protein